MQIWHAQGGPVAVWSAADALVLKWVALQVQHLLPVHANCMHVGGRGGTGAMVRSLWEHVRSGRYSFVCRTDIRGYYRHIRKDAVSRMVERHVGDPVLSDLLEQCVRYSVEYGGEFRTPAEGIGRGCALSPLIGAALLYDMDTHFTGVKEVLYARYMDDFVLLTRSRWQLRRCVRDLNQFFAMDGFEKHPEKTRIGRVVKGFDWLGAWITPADLTVAPRALENHRQRTLRLYEHARARGLSKSEARVLVQRYVRRWEGWRVSLCVDSAGRTTAGQSAAAYHSNHGHTPPPCLHTPPTVAEMTKLIILIVALLATPTAHAYYECSGALNSLVVQLPATINVPPGLGRGAAITDWSSPVTLTGFTCATDSKRPSAYQLYKLARPTNLRPTNLYWHWNELEYTVYETGTPGIGVVLDWRSGTANGVCFSSGDLGTKIRQQYANAYPPKPWYGAGCNSVGGVDYVGGASFRARLILTGPVQAGRLPSLVVGETAVFIGSEGDSRGTWDSAVARGLLVVSASRVSVASCAIAAPNVRLPTIPLNALTHEGAVGGSVPVSITLTNCPAGLAELTYTLESVGATSAAAQGLLANKASSTATGVRVQITDSEQSPVTLGTAYPVPGYNRLSGGGASIALLARYYQTGDRPTAGSVDAQMTYTLQYR